MSERKKGYIMDIEKAIDTYEKEKEAWRAELVDLRKEVNAVEDKGKHQHLENIIRNLNRHIILYDKSSKHLYRDIRCDFTRLRAELATDRKAAVLKKMNTQLQANDWHTVPLQNETTSKTLPGGDCPPYRKASPNWLAFFCCCSTGRKPKDREHDPLRAPEAPRFYSRI